MTGFLVLVLHVPNAGASDNLTARHWSTGSVTWQLTGSIPSGYEDEFQRAADSWEADTPIGLVQGTTLASTYLDYEDDSTHIIWMGTVPPEWSISCPPPLTLACVRWVDNFADDIVSTGPTASHLNDVDEVINIAYDLQERLQTDCPSYGGQVAQTEFDLETIALHEFGHWGVLRHAAIEVDGEGDPLPDSQQPVMAAGYRGCKQDLLEHDIDSMTDQYATHSH